MRKFISTVAQLIAFILGGILGFILVGSVDCTAMIMDASGNLSVAADLSSSDINREIQNGGGYTNLCQLPFSLSISLKPNTLFAASLGLPLVLGMSFLIVAQNLFKRLASS